MTVQTIQTLEDKRLLAAAIEEKRRRMRENGIKYYHPQEQQVPFHESNARIRLACGANRCMGKNTKIYDPVLGISKKISEITEDFHARTSVEPRDVSDATTFFMFPDDRSF